MPVTNTTAVVPSRAEKPRPRTRLILLTTGALSLAAAPGVWSQELEATTGGNGFYSFSDEVPEVLTTTRLRQPKVRVPGTTTVIEGDLIRDLGITSLVEIFRLVPGMVVAEVGSGTPVTTYHGTVHYEQRRMQVLVDGRTAHRTTLSDMDWQTMPVPLELIERIEVARGPNAAAYGINAFLGTINIITRDPADTAGVETRVVGGSRQYLRTFAAVGAADDDLDWRLDYEKRRSDGFDYQMDHGEKVPFHDGHDINVFNYDSRLKVSPGFDTEFRAGVTDGLNEEDVRRNGDMGLGDHPDIDVRDYYLHTRFNFRTDEHHFFHVQAAYQNFNRRQSWSIFVPEPALSCLRDGLYVFDPANRDTCFPTDADGNLILGTPLTARVDADAEDSRLEFELQDTRLFSDDLKLVSGVGYRKDTYRSATYFNGRGSNYQSRMFGNLEYTPIPWLTLNGGGNWESTTTTNENYFSPRVAANFTLNSNHALRLVYSRAVRTPDGFEQNPDYGFTLHGVQPSVYSEFEGFRIASVNIWEHPDLVTLGQDLEEERIISREISYFGQFPMNEGIFLLEVRGFKDTLRDMISGVIQFDDWTIDNNVAIDQQGFEIEASLEYPDTRFRVTYAYLDQNTWYTGDPNVSEEDKKYNEDLLERLSVRHSGSVAIIRELPMGLLASGAMYWADEFRKSEFQRVDLRLAKRLYHPGFTAELALTMQHYVDEEPDLSSQNNIEHQNQFFLEAGVRF